MSVHYVQEWPHANYPPWAHGPGYIISRDIAKFIVRSHHEMELKVYLLSQALFPNLSCFSSWISANIEELELSSQKMIL